MKISDIINKKQDKPFHFKKDNDQNYLICYFNNKTYQIQFSSFYVEDQIQNILELESNQNILISDFINIINQLEDSENNFITIDIKDKSLSNFEDYAKNNHNMNINEYIREEILSGLFKFHTNEKY